MGFLDQLFGTNAAPGTASTSAPTLDAVLGAAPYAGEADYGSVPWGTIGSALATTWPARMAQTAYGAATLPGDVYAGRIDPLSDEGVARATDLVGMLGGGGTAFAKPGAAGIFGGRLAQTANPKVADLAERASSMGATDAQIYEATGGWFPGVDNKMRFEIPDAASTYTGAGKTVGEALSHPDLYAAYPDLARMPFSREAFGEGMHGLNDGSSISVNSALSPAEQKSVLLHEIQHSVQGIEDFARGGSPRRGGGASPDEGMSAYRGLAGETEARNVEARAGMNADQLAANPPWMTQDTPYINQNPHFTETDGFSTSLAPPRLLNNQQMTQDQMREWFYGGLNPGAKRVPGVEGTGFFYPQYPNVMANMK